VVYCAEAPKLFVPELSWQRASDDITLRNRFITEPNMDMCSKYANIFVHIFITFISMRRPIIMMHQ